jgi:hypothetical protein
LRGNGNASHHLETVFFIHKGKISSVKRVEFISDRISYITLRGQCDIVLNVHAPTEDKSGGAKGSFYKEPECVLSWVPKYHMTILLGGINPRVRREDIFKPS